MFGGRVCEMGWGVFLVAGEAGVSALGEEGEEEGRKERTTGAAGSFGIRDAEGLRVQCWP